MNPELRKQIVASWNTSKATLLQWMSKDAVLANPQNLYNVQLYTANLLMFLDHTQDRDLLEAIVSLYRKGFAPLIKTDKALYSYAKGVDGIVRTTQLLDLAGSRKMWVSPAFEEYPVG